MTNTSEKAQRGCGSRGLAAPLLLALGFVACKADGPSTSPAIPKDVSAVIFLQRAARTDGVGNVFDYTSYKPGARLVRLEPPAADGKRTTITSDPMFADCDIMSWDLSFDARTVVIAARLKDEQHYQIYALNVDGTNPRPLTEGPYDHVYPIFLPGQRVMFMTSKSVEADAKQFQDEYERQTTAQVGTVNLDGTNEILGPRNVSHRVAPALLPDGNVIYTEWRHLGDINDGHLRVMNPDMTGMREAFGGEGKNVTNSYLKARHVDSRKSASGRDIHRIVTVGTSRDNTLQAGKLLLVDLNESEAMATFTDLTPTVPGDRTPSYPGTGRYYDAEVVDPNANTFLVSWADGPVESGVLSMARSTPNFGLYLFEFDGKQGRRYPLYDDPAMWDVMARPLKPRAEPRVTPSPASGGEDKSFTVGALNVYETSLFRDLAKGSAAKVRLLEGFSSEEGFPDMFGLTEFDGQSRYGEVPVYPDGSFSAKVPANVPLHMQLIDKFAMSIANENIWISGRAGEQRFCGGCHEDRAKPTVISPGSTEAVQRGPIDLDRPRAERVSQDFSYDKVRGVPWNRALQPIFTAKCAGCHNGDPNLPGNPSYTVMDRTRGTTQTFTFDLSAMPVRLLVGEEGGDYDYPASYVSLVGLEMEFGENIVMVTTPGNMPMKSYVTPGEARSSAVIKKLNPPQRFPTVDENVRAFPGMGHPADVGHPELALTADEIYLLILNIDMGAQYFFRENKGDVAGMP
jgi:Hydrazine synthase alpha subunit middle domain